MKKKLYIQSLLNFLQTSATPFHASINVQKILKKNNFVQLQESELWQTLDQGLYFVTRNDSSLIAFRWNGDGSGKMSIAGAHLDSPCLKLKPKPVLEKNSCLQVGVEVYGGALLAPWFDRELSLAGRVCCLHDDEQLTTALIDFARPIGIIPSLAIHLDRDANKGHEMNKQTELVPIIGLAEGFSDGFYANLHQQLANEHPELTDAAIVDHELFFYDATPPRLIGLENELLTGGRLDNLLSCYACVQGLISADSTDNGIIVLNDHEEVGSMSSGGAQGSFLQDVLARLYEKPEQRQQMASRAFFISADNAHAVHPNYAEKHDPQHVPILGGGLVIKFNANQRYATNANTAARFRLLCNRAKIPVQEFVMRSDMACGSTIGPLTSAATGIDTVDVGIPSLAMHSIRETTASSDCFALYEVLKMFFSEAGEQ